MWDFNGIYMTYEFPLIEWLSDKEDIDYNLASSTVPELTISDLTDGVDNSSPLGYGDGSYTEELKSRIARYYSLTKSDVSSALAPGAQSANYLSFKSLLGQDDHVIVEDPTYLPLQIVPDSLGCEVEILERRHEDGFKLDMETLKERFTSRTKLLVLSNPHNPSGVYLEDQMKQVQQFLEDKDAYLLVDEIFRDFNEDSTSALSLGDNVIVTSSLSKVYGLGGLRMGWAASKNEELIQSVEGLKRFVYPSEPVLSKKLALDAMDDISTLVERAREMAEKGRALVEGWIKGTNSVEWVKPGPGIISFPRLNIDVTGEELAERAREEGILVSPGSYFTRRDMGGNYDDHIRLTFGKEFGTVAQGVQKLSTVIDGWE